MDPRYLALVSRNAWISEQRLLSLMPNDTHGHGTERHARLVFPHNSLDPFWWLAEQVYAEIKRCFFSSSVNSGFAVVFFIVNEGSAFLAWRHKYAALQLASFNMLCSLGLFCIACRQGEWGWRVFRLGKCDALCMWRAALARAGGLRATPISPVPQC